MNQPRPNPGRIVHMASAFYESCILFAASDLGVFALLAREGSAGEGTIAAQLGLNPRGARLLLDGCVAVGLLEKSDDLYRNSAEAAAFLVPGQPGELSSALRYNRDVYQAWGQLTRFARTGEPVEKPELHLGEDEARTRAFVMSMHGKALGMLPVVLPLLELDGCRKLLDVGGGPGTFAVALAKAHPGLQCTVLDLPPIVAIGEQLIAQQGAADRVRVRGGDYHTTPFPSGNDAVHMFGMLHQESPEVIQDLLRRAYAALEPGGRFYVLDMMTDATRTAPPFSALFAVNMALTKEHGWVFSDEDLAQWSEAAGFEDYQVRRLPPPMPHWLASARKPR